MTSSSLLSVPFFEYTSDAVPTCAASAAQPLDRIFNDQKHKALQKLWDWSIKVALRANPG